MKQTLASVSEAVEQSELMCIADGDTDADTSDTLWQCLLKLHTCIPYDQRHPGSHLIKICAFAY